MIKWLSVPLISDRLCNIESELSDGTRSPPTLAHSFAVSHRSMHHSSAHKATESRNIAVNDLYVYENYKSEEVNILDKIPRKSVIHIIIVCSRYNHTMLHLLGVFGGQQQKE
jgi:hypothetical protein